MNLVIYWTKATDDTSAQSALVYEVRQSSSANIGTLQEAEANGRIVMPYAANTDQFTATNLNPNTAYYFTVIVKDEAGNKAVYRMVKVVTAKKGGPKSIRIVRE